MLRTFSLLVLTSLLLAGCGKKSAAELAEEERAKLKADKRAKAADAYKTLAESYPDDPKAKEAASKAASLAAPKK